MTAETFYGLKAGTLQLPWEPGPCGYSSGAVMRLRRRDQEEKGGGEDTQEVSTTVNMFSCN